MPLPVAVPVLLPVWVPAGCPSSCLSLAGPSWSPGCRVGPDRSGDSDRIFLTDVSTLPQPPIRTGDLGTKAACQETVRTGLSASPRQTGVHCRRRPGHSALARTRGGLAADGIEWTGHKQPRARSSHPHVNASGLGQSGLPPRPAGNTLVTRTITEFGQQRGTSAI